MNKSVLNVSMIAAALAAAACPTNPVDVLPADEQARQAVQGLINDELDLLATSSAALQQLAPAPDADGWNSTADAGAVTAMKGKWREVRGHYERVEGAIAVLFGDLDASTDARFNDFIEEGADDNAFDDEGIVGVHALERILWSDAIPENVVAFEEGVGSGFSPSRYFAASFPTTEVEASDFKNKLAQRLADDCASMRDQFGSIAGLELNAAFRGVLGSMEEQAEKVALAGEGSDESRYAQHTLADMRFNLEGGRQIFAAFKPMFQEKGQAGEELEGKILAAFDRVQAHYATLSGDSIPEVPATWNPDAPTEADRATDYGKLYLFLAAETDPENPASFTSLFAEGADLLGIPQLAE